MTEKELIGKVHSAVYHQCQRRGYATPVDVLMEIGVLPKQKYEDWRFGRIDYALRRDRHSQNDVCFGFTRMERGIEQAPFDCTVIEYRMHIASLMLSST